MQTLKLAGAAVALALMFGAPATAQMAKDSMSKDSMSKDSMSSGDMGMSKSDMMMMKKCQGMSHAMMMKDKKCAAMMKMHPDMMKGDMDKSMMKK